MKRCALAAMACLAVWLGGAGRARADAAMTLYYDVTDLGGYYRYDFALVLENLDGSWLPGQGFGWFIFGDAELTDSPFDDFLMTDDQFPVGPWIVLSSSDGVHNGPTFAFVLDFWAPAFLGDALYWTGFSGAFLDQGQMLWSSIETTGEAPIIEFEPAVLGSSS